MESQMLFLFASLLIVSLLDMATHWMSVARVRRFERIIAELRLASIEHEERLDLHSESIDDAHSRIDSIRGVK